MHIRFFGVICVLTGLADAAELRELTHLDMSDVTFCIALGAALS